MKAVTKILTGAAGIAALGMAAPAAAQYFPGYGQGNVIGQVLNTILNPLGQQQQYGYAMNPQLAVNQCSAAVQARLRQQYSAGYGYNPYGEYNPYGYNANAYSSARVLSISRVEPRSNTTMRVRGYATSGRMANYNPYGGYGGYPGYGGGYGGYAGYNSAAAADLTFECDVDYRGYIYDINIDRRY